MYFLTTANQRYDHRPTIMATHDFEHHLWLGDVTIELLPIFCRRPGSLRFVKDD
jgi:hypothetical protein